MFKGGFLSGKKTYFVGGLMVLTAFVNWAVTGETDLTGFIQVLTSPEVLNGLGLASLRAGVTKVLG